MITFASQHSESVCVGGGVVGSGVATAVGVAVGLHALAGHDFQEGLKNYRDLAFMQHRLGAWAESMEAFHDMVDARQKAYAERVPRTDALLATAVPERIERQRGELESKLDAIERNHDTAALGTTGEREQWARIQRLEQAIANGDAGAEGADLEAMKDRLRLVKGVLAWRLDEAMRARVYRQRREQSCRPAGVVVVGMADHQAIEPAHTAARQRRRHDRPAGLEVRDDLQFAPGRELGVKFMGLNRAPPGVDLGKT